MMNIAEKYEQIVQVIYRYRRALPEGKEGGPAYYCLVLGKVYQIVKDDEDALFQKDFEEVDRDTKKLRDKYEHWRRDIEPEYRELRERHAQWGSKIGPEYQQLKEATDES